MKFSSAVTERFCKANDLQVIIRAHEFPKAGYDINHMGRLWTVCSARSAGKNAALMLIAYTEEGKIMMRPKNIIELPAAGV